MHLHRFISAMMAVGTEFFILVQESQGSLRCSLDSRRLQHVVQQEPVQKLDIFLFQPVSVYLNIISKQLSGQ